jgi:hypothetical protein
MSYDMNIGGRCAPGIACPTPMALPTYTQACAPKLPMPVYQPVIAPQQQFGIVGGPAHFTPAPAISYGSAYTCYNQGHQSYNQTIGTLSSIIIGAIFSTPMNGGMMPGQLAAQGGSNPYAAYCPPGQDPNQYYQEQCATNPPGYCPQPHPQAGGGECGGRGGYKDCDPCKPRGPKPYDQIFNGPPKHEGPSGPKDPKKCDSDQWDAKTSGTSGTIKISDRYEIKLDETNSKWVLTDKCEGKTTTIWGDPHLDTQANGNLEFKETMSFVLEDGTKITVKTTPFKNNPNATLSSELYITNGDKSIVVKGLANDKDVLDGANAASKGDGKLSVVVSETNGKAVDKMIDDGALTVYQVGDLWVNGATGKQLTQSQIDSAEAGYDDANNDTAYKGSDKKDDEIKGTAENDRYIATEGDDEFKGGDGTDTAVFSGDIEDYKIERLGNGTVRVTDDDGNTTTLKDVEKLEFNGKTYNIAAINDSNNDGLSKGNDSREVVFGMGGDDQFYLDDGAKTKYFDGGAGNDVVHLTGKKEDYEFEKGEDGTVIITDEGTGKVLAVLSNVEKINFSDAKGVDVSSLT